jgi:hypothetical protein
LDVSRLHLVAVSVSAHVALAIGLGAIPPRVVHEVTPITMIETKKAKPAAHVDPPPEPDGQGDVRRHADRDEVKPAHVQFLTSRRGRR